MKYKKFECIKCGYSWLGFALKPRCRKCGSKMVNIMPALVDESYIADLEKKAGIKEAQRNLKKKANVEKLEKLQEVEEVEDELKKVNTESLEASFAEEVIEEISQEEKLVYKCGCGHDIQEGSLFCEGCGGALEWS